MEIIQHLLSKGKPWHVVFPQAHTNRRLLENHASLCNEISTEKKFTYDLLTPLVFVAGMICSLQDLNQVSFQLNWKMDM